MDEEVGLLENNPTVKTQVSELLNERFSDFELSFGSDNDSSCDSDENYETWDNVAVKGEDIFSSDSALDQSDFHNESRESHDEDYEAWDIVPEEVVDTPSIELQPEQSNTHESQEQRQVANLQQAAEDKEKTHTIPRKCSVKLKRLSIAPVKVLETSSPIKSQQCEKRSDQSTVKPKAKRQPLIDGSWLRRSARYQDRALEWLLAVGDLNLDSKIEEKVDDDNKEVNTTKLEETHPDSNDGKNETQTSNDNLQSICSNSWLRMSARYQERALEKALATTTENFNSGTKFECDESAANNVEKIGEVRLENITEAEAETEKSESSKIVKEQEQGKIPTKFPNRKCNKKIRTPIRSKGKENKSNVKGKTFAQNRNKKCDESTASSVEKIDKTRLEDNTKTAKSKSSKIQQGQGKIRTKFQNRNGKCNKKITSIRSKGKENKSSVKGKTFAQNRNKKCDESTANSVGKINKTRLEDNTKTAKSKSSKTPKGQGKIRTKFQNRKGINKMGMSFCKKRKQKKNSVKTNLETGKPFSERAGYQNGKCKTKIGTSIQKKGKGNEKNADRKSCSEKVDKNQMKKRVKGATSLEVTLENTQITKGQIPASLSKFNKSKEIILTSKSSKAPVVPNGKSPISRSTDPQVISGVLPTGKTHCAQPIVRLKKINLDSLQEERKSKQSCEQNMCDKNSAKSSEGIKLANPESLSQSTEQKRGFIVNSHKDVDSLQISNEHSVQMIRKEEKCKQLDGNVKAESLLVDSETSAKERDAQLCSAPANIFDVFAGVMSEKSQPDNQVKEKKLQKLYENFPNGATIQNMFNKLKSMSFSSKTSKQMLQNNDDDVENIHENNEKGESETQMNISNSEVKKTCLGKESTDVNAVKMNSTDLVHKTETGVNTVKGSLVQETQVNTTNSEEKKTCLSKESTGVNAVKGSKTDLIQETQVNITNSEVKKTCLSKESTDVNAVKGNNTDLVQETQANITNSEEKKTCLSKEFTDVNAVKGNNTDLVQETQVNITNSEVKKTCLSKESTDVNAVKGNSTDIVHKTETKAEHSDSEIDSENTESVVVSSVHQKKHFGSDEIQSSLKSSAKNSFNNVNLHEPKNIFQGVHVSTKRKGSEGHIDPVLPKRPKPMKNFRQRKLVYKLCNSYSKKLAAYKRERDKTACVELRRQKQPPNFQNRKLVNTCSNEKLVAVCKPNFKHKEITELNATKIDNASETVVLKDNSKPTSESHQMEEMCDGRYNNGEILQYNPQGNLCEDKANTKEIDRGYQPIGDTSDPKSPMPFISITDDIAKLSHSRDSMDISELCSMYRNSENGSSVRFQCESEHKNGGTLRSQEAVKEIETHQENSSVGSVSELTIGNASSTELLTVHTNTVIKIEPDDNYIAGNCVCSVHESSDNHMATVIKPEPTDGESSSFPMSSSSQTSLLVESERQPANQSYIPLNMGIIKTEPLESSHCTARSNVPSTTPSSIAEITSVEIKKESVDSSQSISETISHAPPVKIKEEPVDPSDDVLNQFLGVTPSPLVVGEICSQNNNNVEPAEHNSVISNQRISGAVSIEEPLSNWNQNCNAKVTCQGTPVIHNGLLFLHDDCPTSGAEDSDEDGNQCSFNGKYINVTPVLREYRASRRKGSYSAMVSLLDESESENNDQITESSSDIDFDLDVGNNDGDRDWQPEDYSSDEIYSGDENQNGVDSIGGIDDRNDATDDDSGENEIVDYGITTPSSPRIYIFDDDSNADNLSSNYTLAHCDSKNSEASDSSKIRLTVQIPRVGSFRSEALLEDVTYEEGKFPEILGTWGMLSYIIQALHNYASPHEPDPKLNHKQIRTDKKQRVNKSKGILDLTPERTNSEVTHISRDSTDSEDLSTPKTCTDKIQSIYDTSPIYFHRNDESGLITLKNASIVTDNQKARDNEDQDVDYVEVWLDPDKPDDVGAIVECEPTHLSPELSYGKSNHKKRKLNKTEFPPQTKKNRFGSKIEASYKKSMAACSQYQMQFSTAKTFSHQRERNDSSKSINSNEEESERAERHNRLERERRNSLKSDFDQLTRVLPELDGRQNISKRCILDAAQDRIKSLEEEGKKLTEELEYERSVFSALHLKLAELKEEQMFTDPLKVAKLRDQLFTDPLSQGPEEENFVGVSFPMEPSRLQHWSNDPYLFKKEQNVEALGGIFDENSLMPT